MDQHNYLYSLLAVFLSFGIGTLIGATIGENAMIINQLEVIEQLQEEIKHSRSVIDEYGKQVEELEGEINQWADLEKNYLTPLLLQNHLEGITIQVIVPDCKPPGLNTILQVTGSHYDFIYINSKASGGYLSPAESGKAGLNLTEHYTLQERAYFLIEWCESSTFYQSYVLDRKRSVDVLEERNIVWIVDELLAHNGSSMVKEAKKKQELPSDFESFGGKLAFLEAVQAWVDEQ